MVVNNELNNFQPFRIADIKIMICMLYIDLFWCEFEADTKVCVVVRSFKETYRYLSDTKYLYSKPLFSNIQLFRYLMVCTEPWKGHRTVFLAFFLSRYHKIVSHSHKIGSRSHKLVSRSHKIESRSHKLASRSHKILSCSHNLVSRYHKIESRSHKLASRSHKLASHYHKLAKSFPQDTNSFSQVSKVVTTRY